MKYQGQLRNCGGDDDGSNQHEQETGVWEGVGGRRMLFGQRRSICWRGPLGSH